MNATRDSVLPPELLSMVFLSLRDLTTATCATSKEWLRVMAVCRRWREVALSTPSLWAVIKLDLRDRPAWPTDIVATYLSRSGIVDLDIDLEFDGPMCQIVPQVLKVHAHRIRSLQLRHFKRDCIQLHDLVEQLGPRLVSLSLGMDTKPLWLPPSVTSLRSLSTIYVTVHLRARLDALTHIELDELQGIDSHEQLLTYFSELLPQCPNLQTLVLLSMAWCYTELDSHNRVIPYQLPLPRLQTLRLRDDCDLLPDIICSLPVPPHVCLNIEAMTYDGVQWIDIPMQDIFLCRIHDCSQTSKLDCVLPYDRIVLTVGAENYIAQFAAYTSSNDQRARRSITICFDPALNPHDTTSDFSNLHNELMRDLIDLSPFLKPSVLEVHLAGHLEVGPYLWCSLFHAYPGLQKLAIGGNYADAQFIDMLASTPLLRLREISLCIVDACLFDTATLVDMIIRHGQDPAGMFLRRFVICLNLHETRISLDAFVLLPPHIEIKITRGCPICHRVATPSEIEVSGHVCALRVVLTCLSS